jgi:hypothetical protein
MNASSESKTASSALVRALLPNAGYARLWKFIAGVFLIVGLLSLLERIWTLTSDVHARQTWPVADGKIVSAKQQDDSELAGRSGGLSAHTRYWVEYEVSFAVPVERCRTGIIYEGPSETMPCHGISKTRSTQSAADVFGWLLHGYHVNQPVKVLWDPYGTSSTDISIVGESIWLQYNFGRLIGSIVWVLAFGGLYLLSNKYVLHFSNHPEQEIQEQHAARVKPEDDNELTNLDLS